MRLDLSVAANSRVIFSTEHDCSVIPMLVLSFEWGEVKVPALNWWGPRAKG